MCRILFLITMVAILAPLPVAHSRVNPLKQMSIPPATPDVLILFDSSGSMRQDGQDCSGGETGVDVADDGMCTGEEAPPDADCVNANASSGTTNFSVNSGMPRQCFSTTADKSRMFFAKRAMQNVLAEIGGKANFGLIIYQDAPYYRYFKANGATKDVTIFLTRLEQQRTGSWTNGLAWSSGPRSSWMGPPSTPASRPATASTAGPWPTRSSTNAPTGALAPPPLV